MPSKFDRFMERVKKCTDIKNQLQLAKEVEVNRSAVTQAKTRDAVPAKWILSISRKYGISPDWLEFGKGSPYISGSGKKNNAGSLPLQGGRVEQALARRLEPPFATVSSLDTPELTEEQIVYVPKVRARLCAGGGSFDVEAIPVAEHPFPRKWLARMGNPSSMVFMDVIGDSMMPEVRDGDMVLIDQSGVRISPHYVMAVGLEETIYIKRVEQRRNSILLHSENPNYSTIEICGDELSTFRVIGRVVWLCRDCR